MKKRNKSIVYLAYLSNIRILFLYTIFICFTRSGNSQSGIQLNTDEAYKGFALSKKIFFSDDIYLINNCGDIVNQWEIESEVDIKLLESGNLLYVLNEDSLSHLKELSWDGDVVYDWSFPRSEFYFFYDQIKLPNGNVLTVVKEYWDKSMLHEIGMDTLIYPDIEIQDKVVEINTTTGEIVWEWSAFDHIIQQRDINMANYGIISDHPELLNIDAIPEDGTVGQSFMINGIDYHEEFDQILISLRLLGEFVIIDHSTTTQEAEGHEGGLYGKGGDILYRWGNPQNYNRGNSTNRVLYFQHNPNWIKYGAHKGKIICFNNGLNQPGEDFSTVPIVDPNPDENGNYSIGENSAFLPISAELAINENNQLQMYSGFVSSATVLENAHYYITSGNEGRLIELDENLNKVWEYYIPGGGPYRSYKYNVNFTGFAGKDLTPEGKVPGDMSEYECELFTSLQELRESELVVQAYADENNSIHIFVGEVRAYSVTLFDFSGHAIQRNQFNSRYYSFDTHNLSTGIYFLKIEDHPRISRIVKVIIM